MADGDATGQATETADQKLARLEKENASLSAENRGYKVTLDALKPHEQPPAETVTGTARAVDPTTGLDPQFVAQLRARGYKDEDIAYNMRVLNDFLPIAAIPFTQALGVIGDAADLANFIAEDSAKPETLTIKEEVEKLRKADLQAGRPVRSRKDYGIVVKARRTAAENTPDAFEARVQEEVAKRTRAASGASATVSGAQISSQNAGPGPAGGVITGRQGKTYTRDEFERLPLKDKIEFLGDVAG